MIKANELRIGNKIIALGYDIDSEGNRTADADGNHVIDVNIDILKECIKSPHAFEAIVLTPEWLERCGFKKITNGVGLSVLEGYVQISSLFTGIPLTLDIDGSRMPLHEIKYLHQLQNLYFALTGAELIFNPKMS